MKKTIFFLCLLFSFAAVPCFAQNPVEAVPESAPSSEIDSLRRAQEGMQDSVVFTAKYITVTTRRFLDDSSYTVPLDTTLRNAQHYNPLFDPYSPTLNLGNMGLASRDMLFSQRMNIGFDAGFHSLDRFRMTQDSVRYYRARTPLTQFWYVNGSQPEQLFQLIHTQNIKPNWNAGAVYRRIGADGFYQSQRGDHTNVIAFTWYQSQNKRYSLIANAIFNTLKAGENGSVTDDNFFETDKSNLVGSLIGPTRLQGIRANLPAQTWKQREFYFKQYFNIGRIDSLSSDSSTAILPTQRFTHSFSYSNNRYKFFKNEPNDDHAFPQTVPDSIALTKDSTDVRTISNEFRYSFTLRGHATGFFRNELKLDVGLRHDLVDYRQFSEHLSFQNTTVLGTAGYRLNDKALLNVDVQQIIQGRDAGNFLFNATASFKLSQTVGKIILGGYVQNRSPEHIFERVDYQYHQWSFNFNNTKTSNLSFEYRNPGLKFFARAEYYLLNNYLYFEETSTPRQIMPVQLGSNINLLKISAGKDFRFHRFTFENYLVYQKTDFQDILRTPELYVFNSFYYSAQLFKSIGSQMGLDSRYNTSFAMPWYAIDVSQFYNGRPYTYVTYPVIDLWLKASLRRATIFLKENYINQRLFSNGYYTVNRYPMPNRLFVFGVKWNFYN